MIFLFTDFQHHGPYRGELSAAVARRCQGRIIDLMHDAPAFQPGPAGHLLASLTRQFQPGDFCLAVVDPGVGGPRRPAVLQAHGCTFVGPDNGLLAIVAESAPKADWWEITWHPEKLSSSFHGRDLFAPFLGRLAAGQSITAVGARPLYDPVANDCPSDGIIYIDGYGNCVTGIPADRLSEAKTRPLRLPGRPCPTALPSPACRPISPSGIATPWGWWSWPSIRPVPPRYWAWRLAVESSLTDQRLLESNSSKSSARGMRPTMA